MTGSTNRGSAAAWLVVLFVALSALYLAVPTAQHSYDAVAYAMDVEYSLLTGSFDRIWHDYHILYQPLGCALSALGRPAGVHPLMAMQLGNAVAGALLVTLLAAWLLRRTGSRLLAIGGALALGLCGSFWYFSTNAEPYVISTLGLLGLLAWLPLGGETPHRMRAFVLSAIAFGLAVDFHLSLVLLAPVVILFLLLSDKGARGLRSAALFGAISGALVAVPYLYKWLNVTRTSLSDSFGAMWIDTFAAENPVIGQYFLGTAYDPAAEYVGLLRGFAPTTMPRGGGLLQAALYILPLALTAAALVGAWRAAWSRRWNDLFPFACLLVMLLFFASFNLADIKFTVFLAFFLITAAILSLPDIAAAYPRVRPLLWLLPALAVALGAANYVRFIQPRSMEENNSDLVEALFIRENTGPNDGVLLVGAGHRNNLKVYVPYFAAREAVILDFLFNVKALPKEESFARVGRRLAAIEARGGTVWAIADIVERQGDALPFLQRNALAPQDLDGFLSSRIVGPPMRRDGAPLIYPLRQVGVTSDSAASPSPRLRLASRHKSS